MVDVMAIKDFEMPKDCDRCPFYTYHNDAEDDCRITGESLYNVKIGERHKKCPLLEEDSEKTGHWINNGGHYDDSNVMEDFDVFFILFFIAFLCCFLFYITKF